jgi:glyoxylase-like metal-dependent hydrolase (beta-lactamase superfamily II)
MKTHHLNCGTMCPLARRLINGDGGLFERGRLVIHVLLVERDNGLALVDTGLGLADLENPSARLGPGFKLSAGPLLDPAETALRQVEARGFARSDVRDIFLTHMDLDHAGGLGDFPDATVHLLGKELRAAKARASLLEKERYKPAQIAHGPKWQEYEQGGDRWFGFESVRSVLGDDIVLVPLIGHTQGHTGVAVKQPGGRWLLHCGDAYFFHGQVNQAGPACPAFLEGYQRFLAMDDTSRRRNVERLRELKETEPLVTLTSAHCPVEFDGFTQSA